MRNSSELSILFVLVASFCSIVSGCSGQQQPAASENQPAESPRRIQIVVTSEPLLDMTSTILRDLADVEKIVPAAITSRNWKPTSREVAVLQNADLILISGAGYEPWKDRVSLPGSRLRDTAAGYYDQFIRIPDAVTHQHGPEGPHSHPGTVWATWLDPELCEAQLHFVSQQCCRLLPDHKMAIETAEAKLAAEIDSLNADLNSLAQAIATGNKSKNLTILGDAPYYQYLTRRLGWQLQYLHWPDSGPLTDSDRTSLVEAIRSTDGNRRYFLMDSRRTSDVDEFVRESGGTVVRIDLCEDSDPNKTSLPARMKSNLQRIREAL